MFMHFSCIRTIFFLFIDINCVWYFSACFSLSLSLSFSFSLSLSLSLSLSVSCSMAPKRKSTPSRNSLQSGASSSSPSTNSTPSHIWFCDEKACTDFSENFSRCGIHLERQVILSDFFNTDLPTVIYSKGWKSLCGIPVTCPSVIMQEFYFNMYGFYSSIPHFITRVRGTCIVVTLDLISEVIHVPRVVHPIYPGCDHLKTVSKDELSSLFFETPLSWGDCQNTPCLGFAKGSRILNIMINFCYPHLRDLLLTFSLTSYSPL